MSTDASQLPQEHLTQILDETLARLIPRGSRCALLDYPVGANIGDSAIWLGQKRWLAAHECEVVYEADILSYRESHARSLPRDVVVLLTGGGFFGDVWPMLHEKRITILGQLTGHRVIQLPQSLQFSSTEALEATRAAIDAHPDLTLLCRDHASLDLARATFRAPSLLCPDMAFALGPLTPTRDAENDCLWLRRTDKESAGDSTDSKTGNSAVQAVDWGGDGDSPLPARRWAQMRRLLAGDGLEPEAMAALAAENDALARERLNRGLHLLCGARGVITDRLHGHILSVLLCKPHVLLDNSYGKNRRYFETWAGDYPKARLMPGSTSISEALAVLAQLMPST